MRDRQVCFDCGTLSPETDTNYTLISAQFGWRLTRTRGPNGTFTVEWRCPNCWNAHKRQKQGGEEGRPARSSSAPPPADTNPNSRPLPSFASHPPSKGTSDASPRPPNARPPRTGR